MATYIDQTVSGTADDDLFAGLEGDNSFTGGGGADRFAFSRWSGHDVITDFAADDRVFFSSVFADTAALLAASSVEGGNLVIRWTIDGVSGSVTLNGVTSTAGLSIGGAPGNQNLTGTQGDDSLEGGAGDDGLDSGSTSTDGADLLLGGDGNDSLNDGGRPEGLAYGGEGDDLIEAPNGHAFGEGGNDRITHAVTAYGGDGNDILTNVGMQFGGAGDDLLLLGSSGGGSPGGASGGDGDDTIKVLRYQVNVFGDAGNDKIVTNGNLVFAYGGEGDDYIVGRRSTSTLNGDGGNDTLYGRYRINGGDGDDLVIYNYANDKRLVADGGAGRDTLDVREAPGFDTTVSIGFEVVIGEATSSAIRIGDATAVGGSLRVEGFTIYGSSETDAVLTLIGGGELYGGAMGDRLLGRSGDTKAFGGAGDDEVSGGLGNDTLEGGAGDDLIIGGPGHDVAVFSGARAGYSIVQKADGSILVSGADGNDVLYDINVLRFSDQDVAITAQARVLTGTASDDRLIGGDLGDQLNGLAGNDRMEGGDGDDTYVVDATGDVVVELSGAGDDTVRSSVSYTVIAGVEHLILTGSADIDGASKGDGEIIGNAGANRLSGAGANRMEGGKGDDTYIVNHAGDVVVEALGGGIDTVESSISYTMGVGTDRLTLTGTADIAGTGNTLNNIITGNAGDNRLEGGGGTDRLHGGLGDDTYVVKSTSDFVYETVGQGTDLVLSAIDYDLRGQALENLTLTGNGATYGIGNELNNVLTGNSAANRLNGLGGADRMSGGGGNDIYTIDNAGDRVVEAAGGGIDRVNSSVSFNGAGQHVEELALTGAGDNYLIGNDLDNILIGGVGDNVLNGGLGADSMRGGAGDDRYYVDNAGDIAVEAAGGGKDSVYASAGYRAAGQAVEDIYLTGNLDILAIGNELANLIRGNAGDNFISGGLGRDTLIGGSGVDRFDFNSVAESSFSQYDRILDLTNEDIIDLASIDANTSLAGNQAFELVEAFTGKAGQLMLSPNVEPYFTLLSADVNGDSVADLHIVLEGNHLDFFHFNL